MNVKAIQVKSYNIFISYAVICFIILTYVIIIYLFNIFFNKTLRKTFNLLVNYFIFVLLF
jgi:hypothetical protein